MKMIIIITTMTAERSVKNEKLIMLDKTVLRASKITLTMKTLRPIDKRT